MKRRSFLQNIVGLAGLAALTGFEENNDFVAPRVVHDMVPHGLIRIVHPVHHQQNDVPAHLIRIHDDINGAEFTVRDASGQTDPAFGDLLELQKNGERPRGEEEYQTQMRLEDAAVLNGASAFNLETRSMSIHEVAFPNILEMFQPYFPKAEFDNLKAEYKDIWQNNPENFLRQDEEFIIDCTGEKPMFIWRTEQKYEVNPDLIEQIEECSIGFYREDVSSLSAYTKAGELGTIIPSTFDLPQGVSVHVGNDTWRTEVTQQFDNTVRLHTPVDMLPNSEKPAKHYGFHDDVPTSFTNYVERSWKQRQANPSP